MKAIKREELLNKVKEYTEKIDAGALDVIERVAKCGKNILIEDGHLKVTFGINLYTVVETAAVNMVEGLKVYEDVTDTGEYLPFK